MLNGAILHEHEIEQSLKMQDGKVDIGKALDVGLVLTESSRTESDKQDTSSRSGNHTTHVVDANIRPVDSNTTPNSTNMRNNGGKTNQDDEQYHVKSLLLASLIDQPTTDQSYQSLVDENISLKKTIAQFQKDFLRMEAHFVNLEPKYQNHALKSGKHGQSLNETSNKAKIKKEINVLETNIELENSVAKLLTSNEHLNKENEHLKKTYKELYDSIKMTRVQTKDHNDSLIAQLNQKSNENANLKAQIQEKVQSHKTRNSNKHVEPKSHTQKPGRQIFTGHRFSLNKSSAIHEKTNTPRSCLRRKSAVIIFNTVGLKWVPTRKIFTSITTKVDSEPPNGLNVDITNPYECEKLLMSVQFNLVSQCVSNGQMASEQFGSGPELQLLTPEQSVQDLPANPTGSPSSTSIDQAAHFASTSSIIHETQSLVIPSCVEEQFHDIEVAHLDNDPFFGVLISEPSFEESSLRDVISTNVHSVNQPPEHLRK
ncbi:hypothetical protein Tco_1320425 [Tanacetum coccineum]